MMESGPMITGLYAALAALMFVGLSLWVIARRMGTRISLGAGEDKALEKRMRVQANFVEYTPIALLLILLLELQSTPAWALHALGLALLAGRVMHAYGFGRKVQILILRQAGMVTTLSVIAIAAITLALGWIL